MPFCDTLRTLIDERGLTQKQLAKDLEIPVSTLGGYVQGISEPDFETLKLFAKYFNVSADYLLNIKIGNTQTHLEMNYCVSSVIEHRTTGAIFGAGQSLYLKSNAKEDVKSSKIELYKEK